MPFDPLPLDTTSRAVRSPREKLKALAEALRKPLPDGFVWDFRRSESCALGLADDMGMFHATSSYSRFSTAGAVFGLSSEALSQIFSAPLFYMPERMYSARLHKLLQRMVRPRHVARRIERYLEATESISAGVAGACSYIIYGIDRGGDA